MTALRICLVGATHPCHNPRLLREADTLVEMGHEVRVVAPSYMPELVEKDRRLLARGPWRLQTADFSPDRRLRALLVRGRRRLAAELSRWLRMESFAVRAARQAAWDAARARFCWDLERKAFLRIFQSPAARQPEALGEAR